MLSIISFGHITNMVVTCSKVEVVYVLLSLSAPSISSRFLLQNTSSGVMRRDFMANKIGLHGQIFGILCTLFCIEYTLHTLPSSWKVEMHAS